VLVIGKIGFGIANLLLLVSRATNVGIRTYEIPRNSSELRPAPCMCDVCHVHRLGSSRTSKKNLISYSFDSISEADESKEGHL